jgi:hypothetical protein
MKTAIECPICGGTCFIFAHTINDLAQDCTHWVCEECDREHILPSHPSEYMDEEEEPRAWFIDLYNYEEESRREKPDID